MSDKTGIEWTDATWNPVTGCTEVSPGCDRCYAKTFAERWRGTAGHYFENGFDVQLRPDKIEQPLRWTKPRRIFVNSMSDLFHDQVPDDYIAQVFAVMSIASQHTFQILTKRHARMRALLRSPMFKLEINAHRMRRGVSVLPDSRRVDGTYAWPLENVWLGVSVEDQKWANIRVPHLLDTPAAVRFLSCEPLLGPVDLALWVHANPAYMTIDWVIVGGESGHGARPMHPDWARSLRDQCVAAGVPFLFKQWGGHRKVEIHDAKAGDVWVLPENGMVQPWHEGSRGAEAHRWGPYRDELMRRVGKTAAGRELDGRTWDEYPRAVTV